jgi:hypothetical protein
MTTAEQWARRVIEWQASGESADQFAQRYKCRPETLKRWKRQSARKLEQLEQEVRLVPVVHQEPEPAPEQELPVDPPPAVRPSEQGLVVELSCGSRVRVHRGFDAVLLRQLIQALEGADVAE